MNFLIKDRGPHFVWGIFSGEDPSPRVWESPPWGDPGKDHRFLLPGANIRGTFAESIMSSTPTIRTKLKTREAPRTVDSSKKRSFDLPKRRVTEEFTLPILVAEFDREEAPFPFPFPWRVVPLICWFGPEAIQVDRPPAPLGERGKTAKDPVLVLGRRRVGVLERSEALLTLPVRSSRSMERRGALSPLGATSSTEPLTRVLVDSGKRRRLTSALAIKRSRNVGM